MTTTAEIVERLRQMDAQAARDSGGRHQAGESVFAAAADHIESLARERDRAVEGLREVKETLEYAHHSLVTIEANADNEGNEPLRKFAEKSTKRTGRTLAQIDTETEGER